MFREAYRMGEQTTLHEIGQKDSLGIPNIGTIDWLSDQSFRIKGDIDANISSKIKRALTFGLENGESSAEIMQKVAAVYDPWIGTVELVEGEAVKVPFRTDQIVRMGVLSAYNHGRVELAFTSKYKDYIQAYQYSAILDDRTTEICKHLDGKILRKNSPEFRRLMPPNNFNCRSILVAITVDDGPFESISRRDMDRALQILSEEFGGRIGGV